MTAPAVAAGRFGAACLLGLALGLWYGFLRPLRPRWTALSDLLFLLGVFPVWVYLGFGICGGDLRPGYWAGLFLGGLAWELTVGKLLRPVFRLFWKGLGYIFGWPFPILKKIFTKIGKKVKNVFASEKKSGTIE